jgi:urea transport system substrate-binding protein
MGLSRRGWLRGALASAAILATASYALAEDTIKVGILHSLSGTMAISETILKDVMLMQINELNASGGLLGKKVEPVIVDPASNWPLFAEKGARTPQQGQGRGGLRLLDLGVAEVGAAGVRGAQRAFVLPARI